MNKITKQFTFTFFITIAILSFSGCGKKENVEEGQKDELVVENVDDESLIEKNTDSLEDINDDLVTITTEEINDEFELKAKMDTSDWLTYRNEEYGFEVKYPRDWYVREGYEATRMGEEKNDLITDVMFSSPEDLQGGGTWNVWFAIDEQNVSLEKFMKERLLRINSHYCDCINEQKDVKIIQFSNAKIASILLKNDLCNNQQKNWGVSSVIIQGDPLLIINNIKNPHVNFKFTK